MVEDWSHESSPVSQRAIVTLVVVVDLSAPCRDVCACDGDLCGVLSVFYIL